MVRVRTVTLLLVLLWGTCFVFGAYEIYGAWAEHRGPHGQDGTPALGLPELPSDSPLVKRPRLGT